MSPAAPRPDRAAVPDPGASVQQAAAREAGPDAVPQAVPQAVGWACRAAHAFAALFVASLLIVPTAYTLTSAAACLAAFFAGVGGFVDRARRSWPWLAVYVVPCAIFLGVMLLGVVFADGKNSYRTQVMIGVLTLWVCLSGVPAMMPDVRRWFLPAAAAGAIASLVLAGWQVVVEGHVRAIGLLGWGQNWSGAAKFGAMASVQGLLSLVLFIRTDRGWRHWLGLVGFLATAGTLAFAQARGGLVGYLLGMLALAWVSRRMLLRGLAMSAADRRRVTRRVALVGVIALGLAGAAMHGRIADIGPQIERYEQGDAVTEVGQRLALWDASLRAIRQSPLTGSGFGRFPRELERQRAAGEIPPGIRIIYGQTHNEYLAAFVDGGIVAGLAAMAMFLLPGIALLRRLSRVPGPADGARAVPVDNGAAAAAALAVAAGFAGFALTDNVFDRQLSVITFYFLMAWLMAAAVPRADRPPAPPAPATAAAGGRPAAPGG